MTAKPFVTVYIVACNEEVIIDFVIRAHRKKFPNCIIHLYDNYSTDNTVKIAKSHGCIIHYFDSGGKHNNKIKKDIQNNCWKNATTDWVWVSDCDEVGGITEEELKHEESLGYNVIKFETWNMMNKTNDIDLKNMFYGFRYHKSFGTIHTNPYDKWWLFNKKYITEINYSEGSHPQHMIDVQTTTTNTLNYGSSKTYYGYHYKFISPKYTIEKHNRWRNTRCLKYAGTDPITGEQYYNKKNAQDVVTYGYISTDTNKTKAAYPPDSFYLDIYKTAKLEKILHEPLID